MACRPTCNFQHLLDEVGLSAAVLLPQRLVLLAEGAEGSVAEPHAIVAGLQDGESLLTTKTLLHLCVCVCVCVGVCVGVCV